MARQPLQLLQIETILPEQMRPARKLTPEQRLCWAMMQALLQDLGHPERPILAPRSRRRPQSPRDRALGYIYAKQRCWPFNFDCLCEWLDIDAEAFRAALARGKAA
jgi:hypothetical protein